MKLEKVNKFLKIFGYCMTNDEYNKFDLKKKFIANGFDIYLTVIRLDFSDVHYGSMEYKIRDGKKPSKFIKLVAFFLSSRGVEK